MSKKKKKSDLSLSYLPLILTSSKDPDDPYVLLDKTRDLGQVIVRGPILQGISPVEGSEAIANPF